MHVISEDPPHAIGSFTVESSLLREPLCRSGSATTKRKRKQERETVSRPIGQARASLPFLSPAILSRFCNILNERCWAGWPCTPSVAITTPSPKDPPRTRNITPRKGTIRNTQHHTTPFPLSCPRCACPGEPSARSRHGGVAGSWSLACKCVYDIPCLLKSLVPARCTSFLILRVLRIAGSARRGAAWRGKRGRWWCVCACVRLDREPRCSWRVRVSPLQWNYLKKNPITE